MLATEAFPRSTQPLGWCLRALERVRSAAVLHHSFAHHGFRIRMVTLNKFRGDDETEIAEAAFDGAQTAVATGVKVNLAGVWSDAGVLQMYFECDELRF